MLLYKQQNKATSQERLERWYIMKENYKETVEIIGVENTDYVYPEEIEDIETAIWIINNDDLEEKDVAITKIISWTDEDGRYNEKYLVFDTNGKFIEEQ